MTEDMKAMIELVGVALDDIKSMSKADKMFHNLGLNKSESENETIYESLNGLNVVVFNNVEKIHFANIDEYKFNTIKCHLAIHEWLKENGWLDE